MEDFGSVLWVLIILGAMVFNFASQSRKNREKGARDPHHEEAWPSSTAMPEASQADNRPEYPAHREFQPVTPAFEDECQSLEEIPEREYVPEFTVQRAADPGLFRNQTVNRLRGDAAEHAPTVEAAAEGATTGSIADKFDLRQAVIYSEILKPKFEE